MSKPFYTFELATSAAEIQAYFELRRQIFCEEQGLFEGSDRDQHDDYGYPIIALYHQPHSESTQAESTQAESIQPESLQVKSQVVGVVRIYEIQPRLWYGGRLGTHPDFRRGWQIGKGLIYKAVTTANTWGCDQFLATVQEQNVRFFQRLHWTSLEELEIRGFTHHHMEADLSHYPPTNQARPQPLAQPLFAVA